MRYRITAHFGTVVFAGLLAASLAEPAFACENGGFLSKLGCELVLPIEIARQLSSLHSPMEAPLNTVPFDFQTQIQPLGAFGALLPVDPTQAVDPMEAGVPIDIIQLNPLMPSCDDNPYWLGCSSWD